MAQDPQEHIWNLIAKRLMGEASPVELQELERLLRANPDLHYPLQTISDLWDSTLPEDRQKMEQAKAGQAFERHLARMQEQQVEWDRPGTPDDEADQQGDATPFPRNRTKITQRIMMAAFGAAILLIGGVFIIKWTRNPAASVKGGESTVTRSEISTHNGSKTNLVLPDGTRIWLNAGSKLTYDKNYGVSAREVNLNGEAYFDVAHNPGKPFLIHTDRIDIRVLGTSFDVKSYSTDKTTETTLIRGSIEVSIKDRPSEKIILKPNEKLVVANDDSTLHRSAPTGHRKPAPIPDEPLVAIRKPTYEPNTGAVIETSWVDNKLIFRDERFGDLAKDMERWYGVSIRFTNPMQGDWQFTGTFESETIQQALNALRMTADFNYTIQDNRVTIYGK